jgi:signal transduction histidine kinase
MAERMARYAAAAAVALFVVIGAVLSSQNGVVVIAAATVAIVSMAVMRSTGWPLLVGSTVAAAAVAVLCSGASANVGWFALCVLAGWCAVRGGNTIGITFTSLATVLLAVQWIAIHADPGWTAWIAGTVFTTVVCLMARRQLELVEQLRAAQAGLADRARTEERNRIAREMHDVIGHALTVSLLHVASARLAVDEDPAEAVASLAEAERLGRQSLAEVRQAVGMLRVDGQPAVAPMPGASQLADLVEGFRRAGLAVSYQAIGNPDDVTATTGLAAYRIAQEALTNVVRHAPESSARVRMTAAADRTELCIDSSGKPATDIGTGIGLLGMRERAEASGGMVTAGPSESGWQVLAILPGSAVPGRQYRGRTATP